MKIPTELIPLCPHCKKPLTTNLRCDNSFAQDEGWHNAAERLALNSYVILTDYLA